MNYYTTNLKWLYEKKRKVPIKKNPADQPIIIVSNKYIFTNLPIYLQLVPIIRVISWTTHPLSCWRRMLGRGIRCRRPVASPCASTSSCRPGSGSWWSACRRTRWTPSSWTLRPAASLPRPAALRRCCRQTSGCRRLRRRCGYRGCCGRRSSSPRTRLCSACGPSGAAVVLRRRPWSRRQKKTKTKL